MAVDVGWEGFFTVKNLGGAPSRAAHAAKWGGDECGCWLTITPVRERRQNQQKRKVV